MADQNQTFPVGPAFSHLAYASTIKLLGVDDVANPSQPGWLTPADIVAAALASITLAELEALGAAPADGATLTGAVNVPTARNTENSTICASTAFVVNYVSSLNLGSGGSSSDVAAEAATRAAADGKLGAAVGGLTTVPVGGGATVNLTATQAGNAIVVLTGALTASIVVTIPQATRQQVVWNQTTGPFTLTYQTAAGVGVVLPQGIPASVICDGTNVVLTGSAALPVAFLFAGQPAAGQVFNLPLNLAATILAGFAGTVTFAGTLPAADMVFTLKHLSPTAAPVTVGTITLHPSGFFSSTFSSQAAEHCAAGDVLQMIAPATQDSAGADIGINILAMRA